MVGNLTKVAGEYWVSSFSLGILFYIFFFPHLEKRRGFLASDLILGSGVVELTSHQPNPAGWRPR